MSEAQMGKRLTAQLNVRLEPETLAALQAITNKTRERQSDVFRRLILAEAQRLDLAPREEGQP